MCTCRRCRPDHRLDLVVDPDRVRRQLEQQLRAAPGRQAGRLAQRGEQGIDRVRLHRADDHGRHLAALHQRDRDLGVLAAGRAHVGVEDAQRVFLAAHQRRALDHRDRAQGGLLAQVQPLDRPAAGVGQRLDDRRGPDADRVEQRDHRRRGVEVGAGGGEVLADRLGRRAGDDQVADVAVDHLAALVDLGGHAFHDRGGGEAALRVGLGVVEIARLVLAVARPQVSEQRCQHGRSCAAPEAAVLVRAQSRPMRPGVRLVTTMRGPGDADGRCTVDERSEAAHVAAADDADRRHRGAAVPDPAEPAIETFSRRSARTSAAPLPAMLTETSSAASAGERDPAAAADAEGRLRRCGRRPRPGRCRRC